MNHKLLVVGMAIASTLLVIALALANFSQVRAQKTFMADVSEVQTILGNAFTYQGSLKNGSDPANGLYDFQFSLYDANSGGAQIGSIVTVEDVAVVNGLFTLEIDFVDNVFVGSQTVHMEIAVREGSDSFVTLAPRQVLTAVPHALVTKALVDNEGPGKIYIVGDGNINMVSTSEQAIRMTREDLPKKPTFQFGRLQLGGDGDINWRVFYSDDMTPERIVLAGDKKGILASVKPEIGSHFEGFIDGDVEPLFRLNSYPCMRLEMGPGGNTPVDVAVARCETATLSFLTGNVERMRIAANGDIGIATTQPNGHLHIKGGNDQLILEDGDGPTDEGKWVWSADNDKLYLRTANDSYDNWYDAMIVQRSSAVVTNVAFPNGYVQLPTVSSSPPAADCNQTAERGRMVIDPASATLYICANSGWVAK